MRWKIATAICGLILLACCGGSASAQVFMAQAVTSCGTAPSTRSAGVSYALLQDVNGNFCITGAVTGTFTATLGGFTPSTSGARGTPLTVTTSDTSGPLPTGAVDVVSNAGTTNPMYCNVNGVAATASDQYIAPSGGWFAFTIPSGVTTLHCIATGGSTTANMVGGSGLPTGTGGGSGGGGGGGTVAQGTGGASAWLVTGTGGTFPVTGTFWPYTLGQQVAGSSVPVVLTAAQLTTLTPIAWSNSNKIVPWDGTTNITVKAASTAAAQTDTALVERNPDVGTIGDSAYAGSGNSTTIAALKGIYTAITGAIAAGANVIGGVFGSPNVTPTDCSGSITTGGTAQTLIAAASTIHGFQVANLGGTDTEWFSLTTTAAATTAASYPLIPLATTGSGSYATPFGFGTNHAVSIVGATTGDKFSCTYW